MTFPAWLLNAAEWVQTDDRGNMLFVALAALLLCELAFRVVRRIVRDRWQKSAAAENKQRVKSRIYRAR